MLGQAHLSHSLTYTHTYTHTCFAQRIESWENYTSLFDRIFSDDDDDNDLGAHFACFTGTRVQRLTLKALFCVWTDRLDLPVQWLWDMVDEFIYQFADFCRFRTKVSRLHLTYADVC